MSNVGTIVDARKRQRRLGREVVPLEDDRGAEPPGARVAGERIVEADDGDRRRRVGLAQRPQDGAQVLDVARARRGDGVGEVGRRSGRARRGVGEIVPTRGDQDDVGLRGERPDVRGLDERAHLGRLHPVDTEVRQLHRPALLHGFEDVDGEALSRFVAGTAGERVSEHEDPPFAIRGGSGRGRRGRGRRLSDRVSHRAAQGQHEARGQNERRGDPDGDGSGPEPEARQEASHANGDDTFNPDAESAFGPAPPWLKRPRSFSRPST